MDVLEVPAPQLVATLTLPDNAGEVQVKVLRFRSTDYLVSHFYVEMPAWTDWRQIMGGRETVGIMPTVVTMWVPSAAVTLGKADRCRVDDIALALMRERGECLA